MKRPTCTDTTLVMSGQQGVGIDGCPQCRGVWLDRGEPVKPIGSSGATAAGLATSVSAQSKAQFADSDYEHGRSPQGSPKKSWLNNIFD